MTLKELVLLKDVVGRSEYNLKEIRDLYIKLIDLVEQAELSKKDGGSDFRIVIHLEDS